LKNTTANGSACLTGPGRQPDYRVGLSGDEQAHRTRILEAARGSRRRDTFFSGGAPRSRVIENLAIVTFDRAAHAAMPVIVREAADSCIPPSSAKRRRMDTHRATVDDPRLPKYARDYLEAVANVNGITPDDPEPGCGAPPDCRRPFFDQGLLLFRGFFCR